MPFTIRRARPDDAPALLQMNTAFNGDTGICADDILRSLHTSPEIVLIALADGRPAGFCCAQVHRSFCYPAPVAEVTEMYVAPDFRHMGCAQKLLQQLEVHLQKQYGADEIHLLTGEQNHAAQSAYRRAGFLPHPEMYMTKPLK